MKAELAALAELESLGGSAGEVLYQGTTLVVPTVPAI